MGANRVVIGSETGDLKANLDNFGDQIGLIIGENEYSKAMEWSGGNAIYVGEAQPGSSQSAAVWRLKKITYDSDGNPTDIQWASGTNNFDKVWSDRAIYSYS